MDAILTAHEIGRMVRERRGVRSVRDVAPEIGVSAATVSRIERGHPPDFGTLSKAFSWLGVSQTVQANMGSHIDTYVPAGRATDPIDNQPDRSEEYRRIWIECAMRLFVSGEVGPERAFEEADRLVDALKRRDSGKD